MPATHPAHPAHPARPARPQSGPPTGPSGGPLPRRRHPPRWIGAPETRGMPHPPHRIPLVGDVVGASQSTPIQDTLRAGRGLGPIFTRRFLGRDVVFVAGAELVAEFVDESRFAKGVHPGIEKLRDVAGDGLFTAYNEEPNWRKAHDILQPAFTQSAMRGYHAIMLEMAERLLARWDRHLAADRPVDVTADMTRLTLETIGHTGFGYGFDSFERDEPHPFVQAMTRGLRFSEQVSLRQVPVLTRLRTRGAARAFDADRRYMIELVDEVIRARKDRGEQGARDLLGLMLNEAHPETGERLDDVNIRNQVITFLVAGHETTSGALSFALYYLASNPDVLAKAQAEVDTVWGPDGELPAFEQVGKLRYCRRVLDETLRLWPTAPAFARVAREDTVVGGRYPFRRGEWAFVFAPLLHRDPVWGPDVDAFQPDRFTPERVKARPGHSFKPFGTGERACIGRQFALHEATLMLGLLLRRYGFDQDPAYRLRVAELLTLKPDGFTMRLSRR